MNTFELEIVTSEKVYALRKIISINVPAQKGRLTVLARHEPFVCSLVGGNVEIINADNVEEKWMLDGGYMSVTPRRVTLLATSVKNEG